MKDDRAHATHKFSDYITKLPESIPSGKILVHNHIVHKANTRSGVEGFRFWLTKPNAEEYEPCDCGWAPQLAEHYRCRHD